MKDAARGALAGAALVLMVAATPEIREVLTVTFPRVPLPVVPTMLIGGLALLSLPPPGGWAARRLGGARLLWAMLPLLVVSAFALAALVPRAGVLGPLWPDSPYFSPGTRVPLLQSLPLALAMALALDHALEAGVRSQERLSPAIGTVGRERLAAWRPAGYGVLLLLPFPAWVLDHLPQMPLPLAIVVALVGASLLTLLILRLGASQDEAILSPPSPPQPNTRDQRSEPPAG